MRIHSDPNNLNSMVYHLIIVRYSMKTLYQYFPWATALHLYNMTGRGEKLQQLHCYHPFSDSRDIYLTSNHYENYSSKMVPIAKIWESGSWPISVFLCLTLPILCRIIVLFFLKEGREGVVHLTAFLRKVRRGRPLDGFLKKVGRGSSTWRLSFLRKVGRGSRPLDGFLKEGREGVVHLTAFLRKVERGSSTWWLS